MQLMNSELQALADWFRANRLSLNVNKTNFMLFGYKKIPVYYNGSPAEFHLSIDNARIEQVEYTKFLGIIIDKRFTWQRHISSVTLKVSKSLYALTRLKFKLPRHTLVILYSSLVFSHLSYCNIMWGCASTSALQELLVLQKRAIRIINKSNYLSHTSPIFKDLAILKLSDINFYQTVLFVYKCKQNMLPVVCSRFVTFNISVAEGRNLRSVNEFIIPYCRTNLRAKCMNVRGPKHFSILPEVVRKAVSVSNFKSTFLSFLFTQY